MSRRSDQAARIEAALARLEQALNGHAGVIRDQLASVRLDASAAHAGVQALADMLNDTRSIHQAPQTPSAVPPAAGGAAGGETVTAARRPPTEPRERM